MGAWSNVVRMPTAFLICHDVSAVLQHHAHAFEAKRPVRQAALDVVREILSGFPAFAVFAGIDLRNAAQQNCAAAVQVFAHQHRGVRHIGRDPAGSLGGIFGLSHLRTRQHGRYIAQVQGAAAWQRADVEVKAAPVRADFGISQHGPLKPCRTGLVTKADGHPIADPKHGDGILPRIADGDGVGQIVTDADDRLAGTFGDLYTGGDRRVQRHIDFNRWPGQHRKGFSARAGNYEKWRARQGLQR